MIERTEVIGKAAAWMQAREWKGKLAKKREGVYPEHRRREQSLFEHSLVEVDVLLELLPILADARHYGLGDRAAAWMQAWEWQSDGGG